MVPLLSLIGFVSCLALLVLKVEALKKRPYSFQRRVWASVGYTLVFIFAVLLWVAIVSDAVGKPCTGFWGVREGCTEQLLSWSPIIVPVVLGTFAIWYILYFIIWTVAGRQSKPRKR